jgi:hypothetical protein
MLLYQRVFEHESSSLSSVSDSNPYILQYRRRAELGCLTRSFALCEEEEGLQGRLFALCKKKKRGSLCVEEEEEGSLCVKKKRGYRVCSSGYAATDTI